MKRVEVLLAVLLLCANPSLQTHRFSNCSSDIEASMPDGCAAVTCEGPDLASVSCGLYRCADTPTGHNERDDSKPYPDCCAGFICAESA